MDQLKVALAWMAKHHFWLLSGLVVLLSTLVWWMAAGDLVERKGQNISTINSAFSQQDQIASRSYHANESVNEKQKTQIDALASETEAIWQELYDRQRKDVLKWPTQLPGSFRRDVENKLFGDEIDQLRREQYTDYIRGRFKDLPEIINANEIEENASGGGGFRRGGGFGANFGGGGAFSQPEKVELDDDGNPIEVDYTVFWSVEDQQRIKDELDWPTTQSHWRIWVTQEDLWVYETMLRAIAATNKAKGSDRLSNAAISYIGALQVGRDAAKESRTTGRIKRLENAGSLLDGADTGAYADQAGGGETDFEGDGSGDDFDFSGTGEGDGQLPTAQEKAFRLSRRYIDAEGAPIPINADEEPLEPGAFGQEVKRLPVRMALTMDTRWLTKLTTELANADLQIKVTEVRVGIDPSASGGYSDSGSGRGGGFGGERGFGGFGGGGGVEDILVFNRKPFEKTVVIQGVVLIFNPPNKSLLRGEDLDASADEFAMQRGERMLLVQLPSSH